MDSAWQRPTAGDDFSIEPLLITEPIAFQDRDVPPRRWLWDGWVPIGAVTAFYGDGGTGKSLLALQLATACATGQDFLGQPVMQCRVLGVFCEDDDEELQRRQDRINHALGIEFSDLGDLRWISRVGHDNLLMTFSADGRGMPTPFYFQVLDAARAQGAQLVIVDTAADTFAGNENIRPQVRQYIALLTRMALEIGGAVIMLAHPSQSGKTTGNGDGGSTAWSNSVRSRLYLKRPDLVNGEAVDPDRRTLSRLKANYAQTGVDLTLRYEDGAFIDETDGGLEMGAGRSAVRATDTEAAFLAGVNELAAKNMNCNTYKGQANYAPKILREIAKACSRYNQEELRLAMNRLIKNGRLESIKEGPKSRERSRLVVMAPDFPGV